MIFTLPKWASDITLVGIIFAAGGLYYETNNRIKQLEDKVIKLEKSSAVQEKAISIHHGSDWSVKLDELLKVTDLQGTLTKTTESFNSSYQSNVVKIKDTDKWVASIRNWAKQQDGLIRTDTLNKFRAVAVYSSSKGGDSFQIKINKQHSKGAYYKKGDKVLIENPAPPGLQVEVTVKGFLDDPNSSNVLVQMNESLLSELGLTTQEGRYELFVTNNPDILRWKSLEEIHQNGAP